MSNKAKPGTGKPSTQRTQKNKKGQSAKDTGQRTNQKDKQNGAGTFDPGEDSFLFVGKSTQEKEDEWLGEINKLLQRKKKGPEENKFTQNLQILYDGLLRELCVRCGDKYTPMFNEDEEIQSNAELQTNQTPRDNSNHKNETLLSEQLAESKSILNDLKLEKEKIEQELTRTKDGKLKFEEQVNECTKQRDQMRNEINQLKQKLTDKEARISELEKQQQQTSNSIEAVDAKDLQVRFSEQDKTLKQKEESIAELQKEIRDLRKQTDDTQNRLNDADNKVTKLNNDIEKNRKALADETTRRKSLENENSDLQKRLDQSNSSVDKLKSENVAQGKTDTSNKEQIGKLTQENERLKQLEKDLRTNISTQEKKILKLHEDEKILRAEKESLETVVKEIQSQLEEEKGKLRKEKKFASKTPDQKVKELQEENDKLRDRLSQIAGSKLTQGNPAITDLGDPNRPTLLGEKFSELYDNEWTDAMEELSGNDEKTNINTLKTIVEKSYEFGKTRGANFTKGLEKALLELGNSIEVSDVIAKYIKDHRKNISLHVTDGLYKSFIGSHTEYNVGGEAVKNFIKKAVGLCWLMAIQDPPVILTTKLSGKFDTDRFRHYTKSGSSVDYVVWPVVYLHEGGPIICKGVAQGK